MNNQPAALGLRPGIVSTLSMLFSAVLRAKQHAGTHISVKCVLCRIFFWWWSPACCARCRAGLKAARTRVALHSSNCSCISHIEQEIAQ
ncbi:hypothetical protein B0H66DRAFT_19287 [Apodospora peruviana]|uniref:Uncharacterized protein n=1 Tax=Apodospora peruviana TaxID=516989 RepID=A0AAE0MEC7_9PEZI|nr:hypothetical protein B0H66DRAFT_19287 [Apodospora peruviana]